MLPVKRAGVTLVELLVVIAIIGLLSAIIFPAVQSARESSRRMSCLDNLRRIGKGAQAHLNAQQTFPSAGWGVQNVPDPDAGYGRDQPGSWAYNLLAYMELKNIRDKGMGMPATDMSVAVRDHVIIATRPELGHPVPGLTCPSRGGPTLIPHNRFAPGYLGNRRFDYAAARKPTFIAAIDYAGCGGNSDSAGSGSTPAFAGNLTKAPAADQPPSWWLTQPGFPAKSAGANAASGVIAVGGAVREGHVLDGFSLTYLAGERSTNPAIYAPATHSAPGLSCNSDRGWVSGYGNNTIRWTGPAAAVSDAAFLPRRDAVVPEGCSKNFGSVHTNGFGMVFCDGQTRWINYAIDWNVHRALGSRADSDIVDEGKL